VEKAFWDETKSFFQPLPLVRKPPPLVRRCNGTTVRLGFRKVGLEWPYNTPPGQ
jgi:hypothetical protein